MSWSSTALDGCGSDVSTDSGSVTFSLVIGASSLIRSYTERFTVPLQVIAVQVPVAQGIFDTVSLSPAQWAICLATASTVLLTEHAWRTTHSRPA
ncbi:cation transporting ATPase C-terminal domain-containing protein [Streptomyces sp. CdTB01]|uniref:cation transporting ATPase C-terminal domain-containing protein n=1 Tax=Streptomyces sp. CdTB01 TaxID=1725411 RepID=UPI000D1B8EF3|nr:cation transporting ATPase C-terminal domain-containing protein [Streptomyces sp. CdTB01]